jgi:hypothetical protein
MEVMRCGKVIKYHIASGRLAKIICQRLIGAMGKLYTIKPRHICFELFFGENVPYCTVKVREHLLKMLGDAIVSELTNKKYIVIMVDKAWEILECGRRIREYEN